MLIIVEGIDKTGKSTLCEYLVKKLPNAFLLKNGTKPKNNTETERQKILDIYNNILNVYNHNFSDKILILDRFLLSEYVYSFKRGYESYNNPELKDVNEKLLEMGDDVLVIYTRLDLNLIKENEV